MTLLRDLLHRALNTIDGFGDGIFIELLRRVIEPIDLVELILC